MQTVLVIEDDLSVSTWLKDVLTGRGLEVVIEGDGLRGLGAFREGHIDLIIADLLVPKLRGFELIRSIREIDRRVPIVIISGVYRASLHAQRLSHDQAILCFLEKPIDLARLNGCLDQALDLGSERTAVVEMLGPERSDTPVLSPVLRLQVRARLDAEVERLAVERAQANSASSGTGAMRVPSRPSGQVATPEIRKKSEALESVLKERLSAIRAQNYYARLGLEPNATHAEIQERGDALLLANHPDRGEHDLVTGSARMSRERLWLEIARARDVLIDPRLRSIYDRDLGGDSDEHWAPVLLAEQLDQQGCQAASAGEWVRALDFFRRAIEQNIEEGLYLAHFAQALVLSAPTDADARDRALRIFGQALERSPQSHEIYILRGRVYQSAGAWTEAARDYQEALRLNPESKQAMEALRSRGPQLGRSSLMALMLSVQLKSI